MSYFMSKETVLFMSGENESRMMVRESEKY